MKILNLVDLEKSDIKYKISNFPDGQHQVLIYPSLNLYDNDDEEYYSVQIKSRLNNWVDLEIICCVIASLRELGVEKIHLYSPYIVGARSDRKFDPDKEGYIGNNYLKDVICPMINHLELDSVTVMDGHSDCLEMGIKKYRKLDNVNLVEFALFNLYSSSKFQPNSNFLLLSPDAGASKKVEKIAKRIRYEGNIIVCSKVRETNGEIIKTHAPIPVNQADKDIILIDDICDGGRTFINIAEAIKYSRGLSSSVHSDNYGKIYLIVTHGIFSAGFEELSKHFDGIYCTNSYKELTFSDWGLEGEDFIKNEQYKKIVKQLNIF